MFHALGALYKLSVFDVAGWDVSRVRKTLDLSNVLNQIFVYAEAAGSMWGHTPSEESSWFFCSRKLRTLQTWWNSKLEQEANLAAASGMAQDATFNDLQAMMNMDFLDDSLWR